MQFLTLISNPYLKFPAGFCAIEQLRQVQFQNGDQYRHNYRSTKPLNERRILYRPSSFNKKLLCGGLQTTSIFAALLVIILAYFL
ncbi:hypothetical protein Y032_0059g3072 [Ancylostoma ceylanicum]|uniref:Uncharacterized protein n=1 Tax=Ancylostoma ceylanicum TaxID=53326 RepID=A0A016U4C4_9BILA|nr:hypothetical protein Y032_0059g3072 [Ancylostoma ceylanicum]